MAPLPANQNYLVNREQSKPPYYLSSIWMSGYGVASDSEGHLYAVTGNSGYTVNPFLVNPDPKLRCTEPLIASTFNNPNNLSEFAIKISGDLT